MVSGLRWLLITGFLLQAFFVNGQDAEEPAWKYRHQVGINTTIFVKNFLSISSSSPVFADPYLLTYKYVGKTGHALRTGYGFDYLYSKNTANNNPSLTPDSSLTNFYFRIGYEKQFSLSKRWIAYAGADFRYGVERSVSITSVTNNPPNQQSTHTKSSNLFGGGPVLGVEFRLNKRISLQVEATTQFERKETHDKVEDNRFPTLTTDISSLEKRVQFIPPTSIFFIVKL